MTNKTNIILKLIMLFPMFYCSQCVCTREDISGEYITGYYCNLTLQDRGSFLTGSHTFTAYNGNRIDWCENEENTLFLKRQNKNTFMGFIRDCYHEDDTLQIMIILLDKKHLQLIFNEAHSFLMDTLVFEKISPSCSSLSETETCIGQLEQSL